MSDGELATINDDAGHDCGTYNPRGARFCNGCGADLNAGLLEPQVCKACGELVAHHLHLGTKELDEEGLPVDPCSVRLPA
jgi:hypothetical protein